jgi:hypothetical protein
MKKLKYWLTAVPSGSNILRVNKAEVTASHLAD